MTSGPALLSTDDILKAFRRATCSMMGALERWQKRAETGLADEQLAAAVAYELGILGGECSEAVGWLEYQGDGLKIWASRSHISRHSEPPALQGAATMRMAREVYGIRNPNDPQLGLF